MPIKQKTSFTGDWFYRINPFMSLYAPDSIRDTYEYGILTDGYGFQGPNPYGIVNNEDKNEKNYSATGNVYFDVKPLNKLLWHTVIGGNYSTDRNLEYNDRFNYFLTIKIDYDELITENKFKSYVQFSSYLNYDFSLGKS
ncbi:MAG: hypothetical protein HC906_13700 [Bacteroidales bacterium]|nr:hypothetical protein [Bacteroidales bacterium]